MLPTPFRSFMALFTNPQKTIKRKKNWTPILHMPMYSSLNSDCHVFSAESLLEATTWCLRLGSGPVLVLCWPLLGCWARMGAEFWHKFFHPALSFFSCIWATGQVECLGPSQMLPARRQAGVCEPSDSWTWVQNWEGTTYSHARLCP